jgi:AcrR family transcriptional regulator
MSTQKEETRLRLLEAARKLLLTRGFHGVGLEDIAAAAGVSRQAVYKSHFSSKADLLLALARHVHVAEHLDELIQPAREAKTGRAMLEATIVAVILIENKLHDLGVLLSTAAHTDAGAAAAWRERMTGKRAGLRAALQLCESEGRLNGNWQLEQGVDLLAALLSTDSYHQLVVEQGWQPQTMIDKVWEICQQNLLAEPTEATRSKRRR